VLLLLTVGVLGARNDNDISIEVSLGQLSSEFEQVNNVSVVPVLGRRKLASNKNKDAPVNPLDLHRVDSSGFESLHPWASGLSLRPIVTPIDKCCGTMIIYTIVPFGATAVRNTNFYLVALTEYYASNFDMPKHYYHCFVVSGSLHKRTTKLLSQLLEVLPSHHGFEILNTSSVFVHDGEPYRMSKQIGYAVAHTNLRLFSSFVMLHSKSVGPFFAPYWDPAATPFWTDAYTGLLSDNVRSVGGTLSCPTPDQNVKFTTQRYAPFFDGPVALDKEGLRLARGTGFEVYKGTFVFALLSAGYNVEAMHGQPHGTDWRRSLKNPLVGGFCTLEVAHFMNHPYEGLFVHRSKKLEGGFEGVYMKSVRKVGALALARPLIDGPNTELAPVRSPTDRVLVAYAYYEKSPQYKENLLLFLRTAVYSDFIKGSASIVDYVVVVNGDHSINFPRWPNLEIIQRNNSCLDFGSWGVAIAQHRTRRHGYFFVINGSVKGPFLPQWYQEHWTQAFISRLKGDIGVVGLSVNCPDGVGRGIPHVMSMAVMFDRRVMKLADEKGLFSCVDSYEIGLKRESDFSVVIMEAGYNLASMQTAQMGLDFRSNYRDYLMDKDNIKSGCKGIDLDIFFKEGWYQGMSPNPMEFVFLKVSRDVSTHATDVVGNLIIESVRHSVGLSLKVKSDMPHLLLMMHSLDMDGAPRLLFEMGAMLVKMGYKVTFASFTNGALSENIKEAGADFILLGPSAGASIQNMIAELYGNFDLIIFNTIVWANMIASQTYNRVTNPKTMWLIHEGELHPNYGVENSEGEKFWYGMEYNSISDAYRRRNTLQKVDKVVFVADKVRSLWGNYDTGHFETFRGFVNIADVEARARKGLVNDDQKKILLASIGAKKGSFIITAVGTICKRKNQLQLAKALQAIGPRVFGDRPYRLVVIGAPSVSGGRGDNAYFENFERYVDKTENLSTIVRFVPFSNDALGYLALSNLHLSVSVSEAFPLNVLEAMALGVPAMVTPAGGSEEAFMRPGVDGLLLPNVGHSKKKLEKGMLNLLEGKLHLLPAIGAEGKKTLLRKYTDTAARVRLKGLVERTLQKPPRGTHGNVCIIVRTYAGHMSDPIFSLRNMLQSLIDQEYPHWTAFVANTDPKPMEGLYSLLADLGDHRLHVVDPPEPEEFVLGSFAVTDRIVAEQCPPDSDWLLVTNGDNHYEPQFLNHLDLRKDVVAFDFYSRYTHILDTAVVGDGCNKFFAGSKLVCKKNLLKNWHTDLGSYVINYKRWMLEGRTFLPLDREQDGAADGYAMESMVYYDWQVKLVDQSKGCLYSHSPNMYYCLNNSHTDSALWDASRNTCVYDEASITQLKRTHVPYIYTDLPNSMAMFQGRCMDMRS